MRKRLSYANVMATLAFFFALTGGALAVGKVPFIQTTDPIPATSDLTGTYGNPLIGTGKVTPAKIADGAITSAKFDSSATAPDAAKLGGLDITTRTFNATGGGMRLFPTQGFSDVYDACPPDRLPIHIALIGAPDIHVISADYFSPSGAYAGASRNRLDIRVQNTGTTVETITATTFYCLGNG